MTPLKDLENTERPFEPEDIEDVRMIIKAKGKNYGLIERTQDGVTKDMIKGLRVIAFKAIIDYHSIVTPSLEEIGLKNQAPALLALVKEAREAIHQILFASEYIGSPGGDLIDEQQIINNAKSILSKIDKTLNS